MTKVTFNVLTPKCEDHTSVFVTGDSCELGMWSPQAAQLMTLVTSDESGDTWSTTVDISPALVEYRYFTGCILQSPCSCLSSISSCECTVAIQSWESGTKPRLLDLTDRASLNHDNKDVYGDVNGVRSVSRGWLTGQYEICLRMHNHALWLQQNTCLQSSYRVKCEPVDMYPADVSGTLCTKHCRFGPIETAMLTGSGYSFQSDGGISYNCATDHITFKVQTCSLQLVAFKFYIYCNSDNRSSGSKLSEIGVAFFQIGNTGKHEVATIPVVSSQQQIVGSLKLDALVVSPLRSYPQHTAFSTLHWTEPERSLYIGHRGLGVSYKKDIPDARVPENTVLSFCEAARCGADMVEFDVMLTSDDVAVVFHDFKASVNLTSIDGTCSHSLKVPVTDLTMSELSTLNFSKWQDSVAGVLKVDDDEPPFPTLRHCLDVVDRHLKFNIEVKYCMRLLVTGLLEEGVQHFPERNHYVDVILNDIFEHAGDRDVLLSCFDPDVCVMMRSKQTRYPVAFLSQGQTGKYETFEDSRATSLQMAVHFACTESLTAVALHTEGLLEDIELIDRAHSCGLSVFSWGEENNRVDVIRLLQKKRLDGIICDRVDELMQAVNVHQQQEATT